MCLAIGIDHYMTWLVVVVVAVAGEGMGGDGVVDGDGGDEIAALVLYKNYDLNLVRTVWFAVWPDAIPRSVPFDHAIAIKAFASTNPPHRNRNGVRDGYPLAYSHSLPARVTLSPFGP